MAKKKRRTEEPELDVSPAPPEAAPPPVRSIYDLAGDPSLGRAAMMAIAESQGRVYGRNNMLPLSDAPYARIRRMPIGIFWLDLRSGGGLVLHRLNRLWGPPSVLKTTLALRAIRASQGTCRHCLYPLVADPDTGRYDCRCPNPRWWLLDEEDYAWLSTTQGLAITAGRLPEGAEEKRIKGVEEGRRTAILRCEPPPGKKGKAKEVVLAETYRCDRMRTLLVDAERTADERWVRAQGVDPALVIGLGTKWGEQALDTTLAALHADFAAFSETLGHKVREVDFIVIDSTSALESASNLEKGLHEAPKVAARAMMLGRWVTGFLSACSADGLTSRHNPTVLTTSQVSTHGLGFKQRAYLDATDGFKFKHAISLDISLREAGYTHNAAGTSARYGDFEFDIRKNKAGGAPRVTGTIRFWLREEEGHPVGDSDDLAIVMDVARKLGGKIPGEWIEAGRGKAALVLHTPYAKARGGLVEFGRVGDCERFLYENPSIYADLRERVLSYLLSNGEDILGTTSKAAAPDEAMSV